MNEFTGNDINNVSNNNVYNNVSNNNASYNNISNNDLTNNDVTNNDVTNNDVSNNVQKMSSGGKVYLLGAGPGDPGLLTCRGRKILESAGVLIYDRLIENALLNYIPESCELIYAGKKPGEHNLSQQEINSLLAEKASTGKVVVRLKGGDPFLFGRGGEEAKYLKEQGVPYEIIPGITSALAVPAYAGIPLTSRGLAASAAIITGHEDPDKSESSHDWEALARGPETLVFLMGVKNLPRISKKLLAGGRSPRTPVALIERGTRPEQRVVFTSLEDAAETSKEQEISPPAIIIMGEVVRLGQELSWTAGGSLQGLRIINTRPRNQARELTSLLEQAGALVREVPAISILPPEDFSRLDEALKNIKSYSWIVFTSSNGVRGFFQRLYQRNLDIRELAGIKTAAIGNKTARELEKKGILVDYIPDSFVAEDLLQGLTERLRARGETESQILLPRTPRARDLLRTGLAELGCQVDEVPVYLTGRSTVPEDVIRDIKAGSYDLITFTSSSTVEFFLESLEKKELLADMTLAAIGPITARTARQSGLEVDIIAENYNIEGLCQAIIKHYQDGE